MTRTGYHIHVSMHCVTNWQKLLVDKNFKENYHLLKHLFKEINVLARLNSKRFLQARSFRSFPIQISDLSSLGHWTPPPFLKNSFLYLSWSNNPCMSLPLQTPVHIIALLCVNHSVWFLCLIEQTKENIRLGFDSFSLFQI